MSVMPEFYSKQGIMIGRIPIPGHKQGNLPRAVKVPVFEGAVVAEEALKLTEKSVKRITFQLMKEWPVPLYRALEKY